jgi:type I restriction enzyme S subunit
MRYKLGEVCDITSSKRIFAREYRTSGVPFYRGKEIIEKQADKDVSNELFIEEERYNEIKSKHGVPQEGDLLLTSVGTLGVPYIVKNEKFYFKDGNLTWFRNFRGVTSEYIYYWLLSPKGRQQIDSKCIGSTQKALTIDALLNFELDLPPLPVQQEIRATLSALDAKIAANNAINHNLEQTALAVFVENFIYGSGDTRQLAEFCSFVKGKKPSVISDRPFDGALPYLTIDALMANAATYAEPSKMVVANAEDILMVMDGASSGTVHFGKSGIVGLWCTPKIRPGEEGGVLYKV